MTHSALVTAACCQGGVTTTWGTAACTVAMHYCHPLELIQSYNVQISLMNPVSKSEYTCPSPSPFHLMHHVLCLRLIYANKLTSTFSAASAT